MSADLAAAHGRGSWELIGNEFHKRYTADLEIEFEKACALYELSQQAGFVAPRPLRCVPANESIVYSELRSLRSIRELYLQHVSTSAGAASAPGTFRECGRVLAVIHRDLELSVRADWKAGEAFRDFCWKEARRLNDAPNAFLHGDFGFANVFVAQGDSRLIVIDASPNFFSTFSAACYGPIYVDVGNMLSCMDGLVPFRHHLRIRTDRVRQLEEGFIDGYQTSSGYSLDEVLLDGFAKRASLAYLKNRFRFRILGVLSHHVLYSHFRHSRLRPLT